MVKLIKETVKYTIKEFLLVFVDINLILLDTFDSRNTYKTSIRNYQKWREKDREKFNNLIYRLKKKGLITVEAIDNNTYYRATKSANKLIEKELIEKLTLIKPEKWDGKWRLIIFDIPESKKLERRYLHNRLRQLGFSYLQDSVLLFPFECKKELSILINYYGLRPFVIYLLVERFDEEIKFLKRYNLQSTN